MESHLSHESWNDSSKEEEDYDETYDEENSHVFSEDSAQNTETEPSENDDCQACWFCLGTDGWDCERECWKDISSFHYDDDYSLDDYFMYGPTEDDLRADYTEQMDFAADCHIESHMNAGGRPLTHPFRDLRSAARARNRKRKIRENRSGCNSYKCRKSGQAEARMRNKKRKQESIRHEMWLNQELVQGYTLGFRETKHAYIQWSIQLEEEFDEYIEDMADDVVRYDKLHKNADVFESTEPYTVTGETFSIWCQRRIAEMRAVKERRIKRPERGMSKPRVLKTHKMPNRYAREVEVYTGTVLTTTLPTNFYDALGHALLHDILTPDKFFLRQCRLKGTPPFRSINWDGWFGEYGWAWHRNMSGCWEFGYGGICTGDDESAPIPCPCCCAGNGSMYYACHCKDFRDEEGWIGPAPEEQQTCSLVEWVKEGRELILIETEAQVEVGSTTGLEPGEVEDVELGSDWEDVSSVVSETWSVVDFE